MLDWTKPGKAIIVTVCAIIFVFVVHFCCFLLYRARVWLFTKLCIRGSHHRDGEFCEGLNEDSCARLGGGSSGDYSHQQQFPTTVHSEQPHRTHLTVATSAAATQQLSTEHVYANAPSHHHMSTSQQQQQQHQHQSHHQYPPQYSGYQQQPVVAGVNVGVISSADIYQQQDNKNKHHHQPQQQQQPQQHHHHHLLSQQKTSSGNIGGSANTSSTTAAANNTSSLSRTVAHLDAAQREQFLNPNQIVEYKM